jgi:hypothetical protein
MADEVVVECAEMDDLIRLFERRADQMVEDAIREAIARAQSYQSAKTPQPGIKQARTVRRRKVAPAPSAPLEARFIERVMFARLEDFFGAW